LALVVRHVFHRAVGRRGMGSIKGLFFPSVSWPRAHAHRAPQITRQSCSGWPDDVGISGTTMASAAGSGQSAGMMMAKARLGFAQRVEHWSAAGRIPAQRRFYRANETRPAGRTLSKSNRSGRGLETVGQPVGAGSVGSRYIRPRGPIDTVDRAWLAAWGVTPRQGSL